MLPVWKQSTDKGNTMTEKQNYAIELENITKSFGSVVANKNINLNVKQGEILALLGEKTGPERRRL